MHIAHLRQADLNLLVIFAVLAEECHVTRAAARLGLTQPAVSRALQRLRETFHDDLLVREPRGYQPTPKGRRLLDELATTLPRLDRLLRGGEFDPAAEPALFRIAATDHASYVFGPHLTQHLLPAAGQVSFEFVALHDGTFEAMERGRLDLLLSADDGYVPAGFATEMLFEDSFACVVSRHSRHTRDFTLARYLAAAHVGVGILGGLQTIPERRLAAIGATRRRPLTVPYFAAAVRAVAGTELVATIPRRMARAEAANPLYRILAPPGVLGRFGYLMAWHPRLNTDAPHQWLRAAFRDLGARIAAS